MTKEFIGMKTEKDFHRVETGQLAFIWTLVETMVKLGYPLNFLKQELHSSYPEPHAQRRSYHLSFAVVTPDNVISSSTYLEVARLHQNFMNHLKNLKTDWYSTIDIQEDVGTLEVSTSLYLPTPLWIPKN